MPSSFFTCIFFQLNNNEIKSLQLKNQAGQLENCYAELRRVLNTCNFQTFQQFRRRAAVYTITNPHCWVKWLMEASACLPVKYL